MFLCICASSLAFKTRKNMQKKYFPTELTVQNKFQENA